MTFSQHVLVVVLLLVGCILVHHAALFDDGPLIDEQYYEAGFAQVAEGGSPYDAVGFLYPPSFAAGGAWLTGAVGAGSLRTVARWLNLGALVCILWFTAACLFSGHDTPPASPALLATVAVLVLAPGVRLGLDVGNLSFLIGGLVMLGFWLADRRPFLSGLLLGMSLLMKPLGAGALPLLLLPLTRERRPGARPWRRWRLVPNRWIAAGVATVSSIAILAFFRSEIPAMLATEMTTMARNRALSLYRVARVVGLGELRLPIFALVTVTLGALLWGRLRSNRHLLVAAMVAVPLTTLAVWSHTLVLFFPVAALALVRLRRRLPSPPPLPAEPRQRFELVLVVGACALVYFSQSGGYPQLHPVAQLALMLPATLAAPFLGGYWFATDPEGDEDRS